MEILTGLAECPHPSIGCALTIGAYDGVHIGHRALVGRVRNLAAEIGCASAVVTFDRHPANVVRPDSAPLLLTDLPQKLELLATTGVDYTLVVPFDTERASESAEDFVSEVLVGCLGVRAVVVGHDFHFGHGRRGNVALLQEMGARHGFEVHGITLISDGSAPVSSTRIRDLLAAGKVEEAALLLDRNHEVRGVVVRGDGRGAAMLGYPTANLDIPADVLLPGDGIYAGWYVRPDHSCWAAAISLGRRPTFYERADTSLLEPHLLDFDGDLYGEPARVQFVARLRDELRFESVDELKAQMARDVADTRRVLDSLGTPG